VKGEQTEQPNKQKAKQVLDSVDLNGLRQLAALKKKT
jgi:hypothetical protein